MSTLTAIRKRLGSLARRVGGSRYAALRRAAVKCAAAPGEWMQVLALWRLRPRAGSEDADFYARYYSADAPAPADIAEGIVCMFDGRMYHGGLTDRLRGVLSTYSVARRRGIPFYIHWDHPFRLTDYLMPATFDWRIDPAKISYARSQAFPVIIQDKGKALSAMRLRAALARPLRQMHIYSNAFTAKGNYRSLYHSLFRFTPQLEQAVSTHLSRLGEGYAVYTFRFLTLLGDFHDHSHRVLAGKERDEFLARVVAEFKEMLAHEPADRKVLVTSDSTTFLALAPGIDERIYVVEGDVKHIDVDKGDHRDAWLKVFVDQALIMRGRKVVLMRTGGMYRSGFGRFAAEVGGIPFIDHRF